MPKKKNSASTPASAASTTPPTADSPALPPAAATVLSLLDAHDGTTNGDLVVRTGLGRSTVTKALSALHSAGLAVRQEGGHEGTRRIADRWFAAAGAAVPIAAADAEGQAADDIHGLADPVEPVDGTVDESSADTTSDTASDGAAEEVSAFTPSEVVAADSDTAKAAPSADQLEEAAAPLIETDSDGEPDDAEPADEAAGGRASDDERPQYEPAESETAEPAGTGPDRTDETESEQGAPADDPVDEPACEPTEQAQAADGGSSDDERDADPLPEAANESPNEHAADDAALVPEAAETKASGSRLGKGELRAQVEAHLSAHPDKSFTATEIHHVLNRSSGAIANACETLVKEGKAVVAQERKPRRFQWNTAAASETV